jgi:hypothetical protein
MINIPALQASELSLRTPPSDVTVLSTTYSRPPCIHMDPPIQYNAICNNLPILRLDIHSKRANMLTHHVTLSEKTQTIHKDIQ